MTSPSPYTHTTKFPNANYMYRNLPELNWTEGVFLRPHHFQQAQQAQDAALRSARALCLPFEYGLVHLEADENALDNGCFRVAKLQAVLPGGEEVDLPVNSFAQELDLNAAMSSSSRITVYAAPPLREGEPNTNDGTRDKLSRYVPTANTCYDLNSGGNEQLIMFRRVRVLLSTDADALPGYEKMPVARYECRRNRDGKPSLVPDSKFAPPALCMAAVPALCKRVETLCSHLKKISMNVITALRNRDMQMPDKAVQRLERMSKCALIRSSYTVLRRMLACAATPPVAIYTELCRLLMQLSAYSPAEDVGDTPEYRHDDCLPQFTEVIDAIYRLTATEATEWCVRVELTYRESDTAWHGTLEPEWLASVRMAYVSVQSSESPRRVADRVEAGDVFKLTADSQPTMRVRGVRLVEERLPSPLLPPGDNRLWFRSSMLENDNAWQDICLEKACALTWSEKMLPDARAELYLILSAPNED